MFQSAKRITDVQAPMIPVVGDWIAAHPGTISLGQGVVHYEPPTSVTAAVVEAVNSGIRPHRYGLVRGIEELLGGIAEKVTRDNQTTLANRSIVVTAGSNMGFLNAVLAIGDVGDEIILLSPFYFNHEMAIEIAGCRCVAVPTRVDYQLDLPAIENAITSRTRAVVTVSPNNPTGAVYSQRDLDRVNELAFAHKIYHISDEAYENFVYDDASHYSPAARPGSEQHTISLYSFSKAYGMAGWRTAYMIIPEHLETAVKKIQDTNLVCPPIMSQIAGVAALQAGSTWCAERIASFSVVRDNVLGELATLGDRCHVPRPDGAFYALAQVRSRRSDLDLVESLIREFGVAVMPGSTFGVKNGCSLRIAFGALDRDTVAEGMGRLVRGLRHLLD